MPPIQLTPAFGGQASPFAAQSQPQGADLRLLLGLSQGAQGFLQGGQRGGLGAALLGLGAGALGGVAQGQGLQQQRQAEQAEAQAAAQQQALENLLAQAEADRKAAADARGVLESDRGFAFDQQKEQRLVAQSIEDLDIRQQQLAINRQNLQTPLIRTLQSSGIDPQSPEGRALVTQTLTKPQVSLGGIKPPSGFRFADPEDPLSSLETIPGGPADRMSPEQSSKFQLMAQGATDIASARKMIFNKDGSINRKVLTQANAPFGAIPGTDGVLLKSLMRTGVEAQLRAESGAAVPETEVDRGVARFMPSVFDNPKTVKSKIDRLEGLLAGALESSGREVAPTTQATLPPQQPGAGGIVPQAQAGTPAQPTTQADFDALPPGATFINPADGRTLVKN